MKVSFFVFLPLCFFLLACNGGSNLFQALPASHTNIRFENKLEEKRGLNILYYLYFYNGGGVATGDVNNDGLTDIYFTANSKGGNRLYLNKGNLQFEDVTGKAGVAGSADWCSGVTMADVNADGWLDLYVCAVAGSFGLQGHNQLFINNRNGTFSEKAKEFGLDFSGLSTQAAFFDYDHDGDLDCYLLNHSKRPHANIVDTANRRKYDAQAGDRLYRNDQNLSGTQTFHFSDASKDAGIYQSNLGYGLGLAVADLNNDGWEDIYVGNDFHENDYYYVNNRNGSFSEKGAGHFSHYSRFSMGNDAADFDNDGQVDVFTTDMLPPDEKTLKTYGSDENADVYNVKLMRNGYQHQYSKNCLQRNNGGGESFSDVGLMAGVSATDWSWCPLFADFDNDGKKDLFVTSGIVKRPVDLDYIRFVSDMEMKGLSKTDAMDNEVIRKMPDGASHPFFFRGTGGLSFADASEAWGTAGLKGYFNGGAYADLDNDGDLDLVANCINAPAMVWRNDAPKKNFLTLRLTGEGGNTGGIGAKVYLFAGKALQYQQLMPTRGFQSASDPRLHFGLDSLTAVDSLVVVWPNQRYQVLYSPTINKQLTLQQRNAAGVFTTATFLPTQKTAWLPDSTALNWQHREDEFLDYNVQYLIPHGLSTRGPKAAVADVNGDGLDDVYLCGAAGQAGALLLQKADGGFAQTDSAVFAADAACEDVDALFFDANGDGRLDLYVACGGNKYAANAPPLQDRLYLNDGNGHFNKALNALPPFAADKGCVSAADVDRDGDQDLFVGTLADAKAYGLPQTSQLLLNDGKGKFSAAPQSTLPLTNIGMVTASAFADFNGDGWMDLAVTGEWMQLKIFLNQNGRFGATDVAGSTGLWQTLLPADVNGDGRTDLLAGNWGYNTKLYAGKNGPCKLYVKDFDRNGSVDQLLCYTIDKKEYTFLVKDELERSMPVLKKHYLTYGEVAGKTVHSLMDDLFTDYTELKAEVLGSSCFLNDGKGGFTRLELPAALQTAPLMSFAYPNSTEPGVFFAAGNFYNVIPYEGRYDALQPTAFRYNKGRNNFELTGIMPVKGGEIRDAKWLRTGAGPRLLLARNNDRPLLTNPAAERNLVARYKP